MHKASLSLSLSLSLAPFLGAFCPPFGRILAGFGLRFGWNILSCNRLKTLKTWDVSGKKKHSITIGLIDSTTLQFVSSHDIHIHSGA